MTIFPMVMNSASVTALSLHRRCAMAAAPMLPVSATSRGGRSSLIATLLNDLDTVGGTIGMATLCVGGGQGVATIVERV